MKAYQCSRCKLLQDFDTRCDCALGIDPRPKYREKGMHKVCNEQFIPLEEKDEWHERFSWEK